MTNTKGRLSAKVGIPLLALAAIAAAIAGAVTGAVFLIVFAVVGFALAVGGALWASRKVREKTSRSSTSSSEPPNAP